MSEQAIIQCTLFLIMFFVVTGTFSTLHFLGLTKVYSLYVLTVALLFAVVFLRNDADMLARIWKNTLPTNLGFAVGLSMAITRAKQRGVQIGILDFLPRHPMRILEDLEDLEDDEDWEDEEDDK